MTGLKFTRKELYDYVWEKPLTSLVVTYNISYAELKALFDKFDIPVPPNGYWSKLKAGYKIDRPSLSTKFEEETVIEYTPKEKRKRQGNLVASATDTGALTTEMLKPDKLIIEAQKVFDKEYKSRPSDGIQYFGYSTLSINVSQAAFKRALAFFDLFIKYVRKNNGDVEIEPHHTWVIIDGEKFQISLREKQNRLKKERKEGYSWDTYDYKPSGILVFKVGEQSWRSKEWKDGSNLIDSQLPAIIDYLKIAAKEEKERRIQQEQRRVEEAEHRRLQLDYDKRQTAELNKFIKLNASFEQWQKAQNMRKYLQELAKTTLEKAEVNEDFTEWLKWANDKIDWYDPLVDKDDELLKDVDKNTLTVIKKGYW